VKESLKCYKTN